MNVNVERRTATQASLALQLGHGSNFSLSGGMVSIDRTSLTAQSGSLASGLYGLGLGLDTRPGHIDLIGGGFDMTLFDGKLRLKSGFAQSRFQAPQFDLSWTGAFDPYAEMRNTPQVGFAHYADVDATLWKGEKGYLNFAGHYKATDANFLGGGYDFMADTREINWSMRGKWDFLQLDAMQRSRFDGSFGSEVSSRNVGGSVNLSWLNFSARRQSSKTASAYTFISYIPLPSGEAAGGDALGWDSVPTKISSISDSQSDSASLRLFDDNWSVTVDWNANKGTYRYGSNPMTARDSDYLTARGEYSFGRYAVQFSFRNTLDRNGAADNPTTTRKLEYGASFSVTSTM